MDVATLGLRIENGQAVQSIADTDRALKGLGKTADGIQSPFDKMTQRIESSRVKFEAWQRQIAQNQAVASHVTAVNSMTNAHDLSFKGMGRLSLSVEHLASELLGVNPIIGRVSSTLLELGVGGAVTLGVVAGVAAIAYVYRELTTESRALKEESDKLTKSLLAQRKAFLDTTEAGAKANVGTAALTEANAFKALDNLKRAGNLDPVAQRNAEKALADATLARQQSELDAIQATTAARKQAWEAVNQSYELEKSLAADRKRWADEATAAEKTADAIAGERLKKLTAEYGIRKEFAGLNLQPVDLGVGGSPQSGYEKDLWDAWVKAAQAAYEKKKDYAKDAAEYDKKVADDARKYQQDMGAIWRQGIGKIVTDGTKSFRDFFEDVLQLFTKLMARMVEASSLGDDKTKSLRYKLLGYGSAAITGAFAGYQVGQSVGSAGAGAFGGAATGAIAGAQIAGPIGAVVGGLTGLAGGLLGGAKAAHEHALALQAAAKAVAATIADLHDLATGSTGSLDSQIRHAREQFDAARAQATAAAPGSSSWWQSPEGIKALQARLAGITADEAAYIELLTKEQAVKAKNYAEDLKVRLLRAQGHGAEADAMAFQNQQQRERAELVKSFGEQIDAQEAATLALLDQVQAAERLRKSIDELNTNIRNAPSGFRIESYINSYREPRPLGIGGPMSIPYSPGRPSGTVGGGGHSIDLRGATFQIKGGTGKELLADFMTELRKVQSVTVGGNAPLAEALDYA